MHFENHDFQNEVQHKLFLNLVISSSALPYLPIFSDILLMVLLPAGPAQFRFDLLSHFIRYFTLIFPQEVEVENKERTINEVKFKVKCSSSSSSLLFISEAFSALQQLPDDLFVTMKLTSQGKSKPSPFNRILK